MPTKRIRPPLLALSLVASLLLMGMSSPSWATHYMYFDEPVSGTGSFTFGLGDGDTYNGIGWDGPFDGADYSVTPNGDGTYTVNYTNAPSGVGLRVLISAGPGTPSLYDINGGPFMFAMPEPPVWIMMAAGFIGMGALARLRSRRPVRAV